MKFLDLLLIAIGLSMDAFSVSCCKGLAVKEVKLKHLLLCGIFFGGFQGGMPILGYFLGKTFASFINSIDHWIAFGLLLYIGVSMIKESREEGELNDDFSLKTMTVMAIATSIDALTIGISFALLEVDIWFSSIAIAITTFLFSAAGVVLGHKIGQKLGKNAELIGGLILISLGLKILIEHLFF